MNDLEREVLGHSYQLKDHAEDIAELKTAVAAFKISSGEMKVVIWFSRIGIAVVTLLTGATIVATAYNQFSALWSG